MIYVAETAGHLVPEVKFDCPMLDERFDWKLDPRVMVAGQPPIAVSQEEDGQVLIAQLDQAYCRDTQVIRILPRNVRAVATALLAYAAASTA